MKLGTPKFQKAHGFRRGQPVVRVDGGYTLASTSTGWTGVVGSVLSADQFELVTGGEIDNLPSLVDAGDNVIWYLSSTSGTLSINGTIPVGRVTGQTFLVQGSTQTIPASTQSLTISNLLPTNVSRYLPAFAGSSSEIARADHKHGIDWPTNIAYVDVDNRFSVQQTIIGSPPTTIGDGEAVIGGGSGWFTGKVKVDSDLLYEANATWTLPVDVTEIGHGVVATGGYFYCRSGLEVLTQGTNAHNFGLLCEFDPSTDKGSMVAWRDQRDGKVIGHVGIDIGSSRQFNLLTEPDTTLSRDIHMRPGARSACRFQYDTPTDETFNTSIGQGRVLVKTDLGVGAVPDAYYFTTLDHATKAVKIYGAAPGAPASVTGSTDIGDGWIRTIADTTSQPFSFKNLNANGFGMEIVGGGASLASLMIASAAITAPYVTAVDQQLKVSGVTVPTAVALDEAVIGKGEFWLKGGTDYDDDVNDKTEYDEIKLSGGNGFFGGVVQCSSIGADVMSQLENDELQFFTAGKAEFAGLDFQAIAQAGKTTLIVHSDDEIQINPVGQLLISGAAPSSVSAGQVAIGGGEIRAAGKITFGAGSYSSGDAKAFTTATDGLLLCGKVGSANDFVLVGGNGGNVMDVPTGGVNTKFYGGTSFAGTAPSSVSAGQVAIGGGDGRFAGSIYSDDFLVLPKTSGKGIKVDTAAPTFGWRDLHGEIVSRGVGANDPSWATYKDNQKGYQFTVGDEVWMVFHPDHDYVPGTEVFIHPHWSHTSATVTSGSATWGFDVMYAKGHNQGAFGTESNFTVVSTASTTRYQHLIPEVQITSGGGLFNGVAVEPDGLFLVRIYLSANSINGTPEPFLHRCDLHYQSTGIGTKNRTPNFYS